MTRRLRSEAGVSVVELLASLGIGVTVLAVAIAAMSSMMTAWVRDSSREVQYRDSRTAIETMVGAVKAGTGLTVHPSSRTFQVRAADGRILTFARSATSLVYTDSSVAASRVLAKNVSAFTVTGVMNGSNTVGVDISLTIGPESPGVLTTTRVLMPGW